MRASGEWDIFTKGVTRENLIHYHVQWEDAVFEPENSLEALMQAAGKDRVSFLHSIKRCLKPRFMF